MKIALFGGSFDPPHFGHESIVRQSLRQLDIDKLIIMPTFISPFKQDFKADEKQRLAWVKRLWGNLDRVIISDYEIKQKRPVPSIQSVEYLQNEFKPSKFYLIIGADHLQSLSTWHEFERLQKSVEFVIASRLDIIIPENFIKLDIHEDIASSFIRQTLNTDKISKDIKEEVKNYYQNLQKSDKI